jgi:hypothetical protein
VGRRRRKRSAAHRHGGFKLPTSGNKGPARRALVTVDRSRWLAIRSLGWWFAPGTSSGCRCLGGSGRRAWLAAMGGAAGRGASAPGSEDSWLVNVGTLVLRLHAGATDQRCADAGPAGLLRRSHLFAHRLGWDLTRSGPGIRVRSGPAEGHLCRSSSASKSRLSPSPMGPVRDRLPVLPLLCSVTQCRHGP